MVQQAEVLQQHTDLHVEVLCGELGVDWWNAARWAQLLAAADCLVSTPQIILDALRHGYLKVCLASRDPTPPLCPPFLPEAADCLVSNPIIKLDALAPRLPQGWCPGLITDSFPASPHAPSNPPSPRLLVPHCHTEERRRFKMKVVHC